MSKPTGPRPNTNDSKIRVMVADDHEQRGQLLVALLTDLGYQVVGLAGPGSYLPTLVADAKPDIILVDTDSPSRDTLEQLSIIHRDQPSPVVMFANDEDRGTIEEAIRVGVSTYIVDGLNNAKVKPIIDVAIAHFQRHQSLREELERAQTTLTERKTIDRAKGLLMDQRNCSEQEAFALLRSVAMRQKKRIGEVAGDILQVADVLSGKNGSPPANTANTNTQDAALHEATGPVINPNDLEYQPRHPAHRRKARTRPWFCAAHRLRAFGHCSRKRLLRTLGTAGHAPP